MPWHETMLAVVSPHYTHTCTGVGNGSVRGPEMGYNPIDASANQRNLHGQSIDDISTNSGTNWKLRGDVELCRDFSKFPVLRYSILHSTANGYML